MKDSITAEQRSGYGKIKTTLCVGVGELALEGLIIAKDIPVSALGQAIITITGIGLAGSSAVYLWDLRHPDTQHPSAPEQSV